MTILQGEPTYHVIRFPKETTEQEVRRRLDLFDKHVALAYSRICRRDFDVEWTSIRGSVSIIPGVSNPQKSYTYELKSLEDPQVCIDWMTFPHDICLKVEGLDFHLWFDRLPDDS